MVKAFLYILTTILYGWVGAAKEFFAILCKLYRRWRSRKGKGRVVATSDCVPIYNLAFVKPDLLHLRPVLPYEPRPLRYLGQSRHPALPQRSTRLLVSACTRNNLRSRRTDLEQLN
jgi:hypothetical protein